jgi:hypothetical protein
MALTDTRTGVEAPSRRRRRNPAPFILGAVVLLLIAYYIIVGISGTLQTSTQLPITGDNSASGNYLTLQMNVQNVDLTNRVMQANVLPVPHGDLVGSKPGEVSKNLRIEVYSGGVTTSVVTYPGQSIVDPTSLTLALDRGDTNYPLDTPFANFELSIQNDKTGEAVPFRLSIQNSARPWVLTANVGSARESDNRVLHPVTITGHRDVLSVTLVGFYVLAILLTTLLAVVTIGTALIRKKLEFSNIIWLSATLLSFPALRSAMPAAPPIGTALDYVIFFPCICLIAAMLVWTGAYLLWRESAVLRRLDINDDDKDSAGND